MSGARARSRRSLAVTVTLLAVTVAALVAAAAAVSGAGTCSGAADPTLTAGASDAVCYQLVRTLAERVGLASGAVTAILALTVVGLSRMVVPADPRTPDRPPA